MSIGMSFLIALLGIAVVLIILIILIFLLYGFKFALEPTISFFGKIKSGIFAGFKKVFKRKKSSASVITGDVETDNIDEEMAAVMAAVNCYMAVQYNDNNLEFVVKSIKRHV